jgi:hypothetical protein
MTPVHPRVRPSDPEPLIHAFAGSTAEQRTILMLMERMAAMEEQMERVGALEEQMLAAQRKVARLETLQLVGGGTAYTVGKRCLWSFQLPPPHRSANGGFVALTDLGPDLVERALARSSGPLYEHISRGEYDRNNPREPLASFLKERMHLGSIRKGVVFCNNVDVGMLNVVGGSGTLIDVIEDLHAALEEDDCVLGPPRCMHSIRFNYLRDSAIECVNGFVAGILPPLALPVVPGGMEAALERYITDRNVTDQKRAQGIRDTFARTWSASEANGSTKTT